MTESETFSPTFHPLTPERWADFEQLFGPRGAYGGCWCMWWRCKRSEFEQGQGEGNRQAIHAIVQSDQIPGILAYREDEPVGWCSVAPRQQYGSLNRSRVLKPIDDAPVWSLVCLFVAKGYQRKGIGLTLIGEAIDYVRKQGGKILEAYPTVPRSDSLPAMHAFMGTPTMFQTAGFVEVARPSQAKMVMRRTIEVRDQVVQK